MNPITHDHDAFWKKLDILAIPLIFAFFNLSTPCDVFDLFFRFLSSLTFSLSLLFDLEVFVWALASVVLSSSRAWRCASSFEKLKNISQAARR
jgi:hypothetical protein